MVDNNVRLTIVAELKDANVRSRIKSLFDGIKPPQDILGLKEASKTLQKGLSGLKLPKGLNEVFKGNFQALNTELRNYEKIMSKPNLTKADAAAATQSAQKIRQLYQEITRDIQNLNNKQVSPTIKTEGIKQLEKELVKNQKVLDETKKKAEEVAKSLFSQKSFSTPFEQMKKALAKSSTGRQTVAEIEKAIGLGQYQAAYDKLGQLRSKANLPSVSGKSQTVFGQEIGGTKGVFSSAKAYNSAITQMQKQVMTLGRESINAEHNIKAINAAMNSINSKGVARTSEEIKKMGDYAKQSSDAFRTMDKNFSKNIQQSVSQERQVSDLRSQVNYFFGLQNQIFLFKRAVREAIETVKELDASMTQTAVVTDFSVGDMWDQLPKYTAKANELGVAINDVYKANTLYFQQGLDEKQSMELGTETLKMARIANMDAAEATDLMTAALRGFNMELNATSAQRVNDVYSKLAAITASDTHEIGIAVSKTASLASSSGMDLETTSALLAQIIETTREAPETAGTALKTIIARFGDIKEIISEGKSFGQDEEGEDIYVNRVDKALATAGIRLKDFATGQEGLGEVFLKLGKRWDSLSISQQRYIATQASGARQQSRFIAMLQDYGRTQELVTAAYNSGGAAEVQFQKIQDSYDAKMKKMKNAWDEFIMGFSNEKIIKGGVDATTGVLDTINKVIKGATDGVKGFNETLGNTLQTITTLGIGLAGLKIAGGLFDKLAGGVAGAFMARPGGMMRGFRNGLSYNEEEAAQKKDRHYYNVMPEYRKRMSNIAPAYTESYKALNNFMEEEIKSSGYLSKKDSFGMSQISKKPSTKDTFNLASTYRELSKWDSDSQSQMFKQSPRVKNGIKNTFKEAVRNADLEKATKKIANGVINSTFKGIADGTFTPAEGVKRLMTQEAFNGIIDQDSIRAIYDQIKDTNASPKVKKAKGSPAALKRVRDIAASASPGSPNINPEYKGSGIKAARGQKMNAAAKAPLFIDKVGNAAQNAGMKVQQLGMALSSLGFETLGSLASGFGTAIMGIVPAITSVTGKFKEFRNLAKETSLSNALGETFSSPLSKVALGATAVVGAYMLIKKRQQDLIESGKKVFDTYTKQKDNIEKNTSSLDGMKDKFSELSKGVDKYGKNISLSTSKYKEYQEMVDKITKMSPELIKGYNSEGKAIIDNSTAIEEAYKNQKTAKEDNIKDFVTDSAVDKVAKGIRAKDGFKDLTKSGNLNSNVINAMGNDFTKITKAINEADIETNAFKDSLDQLSGSSIELGNLSASNLQFIANHEQDLSRMIMNKSKKELSDEQKTAIQDSFSEYKQNWAKLRTEIDPIVQQMTQYLSQKGFSPEKGGKIGEDFVLAFNNGIQDLSLKGLTSGWDGETFKKESLNFAKEISKATGNNSEYIENLNKIKDEQQKYLENINDMSAVSEYNENIGSAAAALDELAEKQDKTTASGRALAETMHEQAEAARSFTEDYEIDIGEALNSAQSEIEAARKSYETFQKEIEKGDFYTGNENKKKIYDEIRDSKGKSADEVYSSNVDDAGQGSTTYYKGARELLGDDYVEKNFGNVKKINKQLDYVAKGFEAGQKGVDGFVQIMLDNKEKLIGKGDEGYLVNDGKKDSFEFGKKAQEEGAHAEIAKILGMSETSFVSMMDQAQQYSNLNFANMEKISAFLKQNGVVGKEQTYYSKKALTDEMDAQNMGKKQRDYVFKNLKDDNITLVDESNFVGKKGKSFTKEFLGQQGFKATDIIAKTGDNFKDSLKSVSKIFEGVGITDSEKIAKILNDQLPKGEKQFQKSDIEAAQKALQQEEENPLDSSTNSHVSSIDSKMDTLITASGVLTADAKKKYEKLGSKEGKDAKARKEFDEVAKDKNIFDSGQNYDKAKGSMQKTIDQTANAISELTALKNKETDKNKQAEYAEWIKNLNDNLKYYNETKESNDKEWKKTNQQSFDQTGISLDNGKKGGQKEINKNFRNNYGVDFSNAWNSPVNASSISSLIGYMNQGNISRNNQLQVKDDYIDQHQQEIRKMNSYEAFDFMRALGPITDSTKNNLIKLNNAFKENKKATDENSNSKEQNTKQEKKNKSSKQKKEVGSSQSNNKPKSYNSSKYRVDGEIRASKRSGQKQDRGLIGNWLYGIYKNGFTKKGTQIKETQKGVRGGSFLGGATDASKGNTKSIKNKVANIKAKVTGKKDVDTLGNSIKKLPKSKKPKIKPVVKGKGDVKTLGTSIKKLPKSKKPKIKADVKGQTEAVNLKTAIDNVPKKTKVKLGANVSGLSAAQSLNSEVSSFESKGDHTVTLTVNKVVKKKKEPHTGGFITGEGGNQAVQYRKKGGKIFQRKGTDTVPAMLTPGEYVHKRSTVEHFGVDFMRKINHKDLGGAIETLGSSAKGKKGIIGPDNKGGLTLTGEKGYEVAWFPSKNRSAILGLNGPEIADLPSDTVVYDHDQSKKIVKGNQNRPEIGSMAGGNIGLSRRNSGGGGSKKESKSTVSNDTKSAAKDAKSAAKNSKKASGKFVKAASVWEVITGKVSSWWDNISRKIDASTRSFNKAMDKVSKALNSTVATGPKVFKALTEASKKAAVAIENNIKAYKKATINLNIMSGTDKKKINRYEALKKKKKRTKKEQKEFNNLKKWGQKRKYISKKGKVTKKGKKAKKYMASISYERKGYEVSYKKLKAKGKNKKKNQKTNKKNKILAKRYANFLMLKSKKNRKKYKDTLLKRGLINKKGKLTNKGKKQKSKLIKAKYLNKKGKLTKEGKRWLKAKKVNKTKKEKVDLTKYIKYDKRSGGYVINDKALNNIKDKNKKKAIQDKANEKINDYNQKRNDALDALKDIQDQATSTGEELYEKFHSWKRTLEEIEVISQRIAELSERISIAEAKGAKANNELLAGKTADIAKAAETMSKAIEDFIRFNEQSIDEIKQSREKIGKKMDKENSDTDEKKAVTDTTKKYNDITAKIDKLKSKYNLNSVEDLYRLSNNEQYVELLAKQREANLEKEKAESDLKVQQAVTKIAKGKKNADGTYTYNIDWGLFDQYANSEDYTSEQMDEIQERISTLISLNSDYLKTMTDELNTENAILERLAQIRKDISDGSQKLAQVLMDREQRVVDNLSKINDTIKNATSKILDDVRDALDKRRQQDQNQKTEKSISDKQNRLAYLQNDTAGGHQVEILQLQKEIGDEQQSYRETLEDQLLTNLQKQADQASAQRERQIALLQTMVNWNKESGVYAREIDKWLNDPKKFETQIKNAFRESILGDQFETWITKENASEEAFGETSTLTANVDKYQKDRKELINKANNAIKAAEQKYAEAQNGKYKGYVTPEQLATLKSRTDTLRKAVNSGTQGEINDALGNADDGTGVLGAQKVVQSGIDRKAADDKRAAEEAARRAIEEEIKRKLEEEERRAAAADRAAQEQANSFAKSINALALRPKTKPLTNSEKKEFVKEYDSLSSLAKSKLDSSIKSKIEQFRYDISPEGIYRTAIYNAGVNGVIGAKEFLSVAEKANNAGYTAKTYMQDLANTKASLGYGGLSWEQVIRAAKDAGYKRYRMAATFSSKPFISAYNAVYGANAYKDAQAYIKKYNVKGYKMGGLADYTGPAWLDGTKSKPELVLNAQDTKNFLALRDTLSGLQNNQFTPQSSGDLNFDIDINVEKIDNDYDVKKVAEAVKKEIVQSAKYRNVNIVRNLK